MRHPEDRPSLEQLAPWMPQRSRSWRCCRGISYVFGVIASLLLLFYMMILGILLAIFEAPKSIIRYFMRWAMTGFGMIVEYLYSLPICKLHVHLGRSLQQRGSGRKYHSRYLDIRTELSFKDSDGRPGNVYIHAIPFMTDNYCYVVVDASAESKEAALAGRTGLPCCVIDPADSGAITSATTMLCEKHYSAFGGLTLEAVLCTHKHWDHSGGNYNLVRLAAMQARELERRSPDSSRADPEDSEENQKPPLSRLLLKHPLKVFSGLDEGTPACTDEVGHGQHFEIGALLFEAIATPAHTTGSVMFRLAVDVYHEDDRPGAGMVTNQVKGNSVPMVSVDVIFTGDTLFSAGCGAQFEGCELDTEHCFATLLSESIATETLLFPGHEYTCQMLDARVREAVDTWGPIEPPGQFLAFCGAYYSAAHRRSVHDKVPTVPVTLASERILNPNFDRNLRRWADVLLTLVDAQVAAMGDQSGDDERKEAEKNKASSTSLAVGPLTLGSVTAQPAPAVRSFALTGAKALPPRTRGPMSPTGVQAAKAEPPLGSENANTSRSVVLSAASSSSDLRAPLLSKGNVGPALQALPKSGQVAPSVVTSPGAPGGPGNSPVRPEIEEVHFATGSAAPSMQFAFLYRTELEELRVGLAKGTISGVDAANHLVELENRVFTHHLVSGPKDRFDDNGLTPHEELEVHFMGKIPQPKPLEQEVGTDEGSSEETSIDTEDLPPAPGDLNYATLPSEEVTTAALKVLGVLPQVSIGPKAPVSDEELPVCLDRLLRVLRQLGVDPGKLQAMAGLFEKDGLNSRENADSAEGCFSCWPGQSSPLAKDAMTCSPATARKLSATIPSEKRVQTSTHTVLPLRRVLQSLRPKPVQRHQQSACCWPFDELMSDLRKMRREFRRTCRRCFRGSRSKSEGIEDESQNLNDPPELEETMPDSPPTPRQLERNARTRLAIVERCFGVHSLDGCALCTGSFRSRKRQYFSEVPGL